MMVASWDEIRGKIKHAYDKIESAYQKHVVSAVDKVKERPLLNAVVKESLSTIPLIGPSLRDLYDHIGGGTKKEEDKVIEILDFLRKLGQQNREQFDRIAEDLRTNGHRILDAIAQNKIELNALISRSFAEVLEKISTVESELHSLLEALNTPLKGSIDAGVIAGELDVHESAGVGYIRRGEDTLLEHELLHSGNKIVLIRGGPGSGKSRMLYNALMYCKEYFSTFFLIPSFFREGDEKSLDLVLSNNDINNFVIVWDDLHQAKPEFVDNVIERIKSISRSKNFRFIGASRKDIFVRDKRVIRVNIQRFGNIRELVSECAKAFDVKLNYDVTPEKIFTKGDGTPYYTISLFKMFKHSEITLEQLDQLPSDVTALWRNYFERSIQNSKIAHHHINAFRTIGLLSHASSEPSQVTKDRIHKVYDIVFHGVLSELDYALKDLVINMFVSRSDLGSYYAHDSHIDALESIYPIEKHHVLRFVEYESDIMNLWAFTVWALYKRNLDYHLIINSRIIELEPNDAVAWYNRGIAFADLAQYEEAIKCYDKAIEIEPNDGDARNNRGIALFNLGRHEEAIKCYDKAIQIEPNRAAPRYNKGLALDQLGQYEEAIKCYDKAIEIEPNHINALHFKGLSLDKVGRHEEAIKCYEQVIDIDPGYPEAWYNKGLALDQLGQYEEAIKCYDKAIEIEPDPTDAWYNKGIDLFILGMPEEAIKCYDKAIDIKPNHVGAWNNKGSALHYLGMPEEAIKCYDKAIDIKPGDVAAWYNKGLALDQLGQYEEAIKCYDKALLIDPYHANAWYYKGVALDKLGKTEEAQKCFKKARELGRKD
jgi:tetratricopeptide (TPR) repeat protein